MSMNTHTSASFGTNPLVIACCSRKHVYNLTDVIRFEASSNYTLIHAVNQRPLVVARVLCAYEELLEGLGFIRVHRSHLVNRRYIQAIDGNGNLVLEDQSSIEVSRRRKKDVFSQLNKPELRAAS